LFPVYMSRTSSLRPAIFGPTPTAPFPQIREAEASMRALVRLARHRIIIESQYFWSKSFAEELLRRIARVPRTGDLPFRVEIVLADLRRVRGLSRMMAEQSYTLLKQLQDAARENPKVVLQMVHPRSRRSRRRTRPVYVHSKLMLVDDRWLSIGSVNLADRAFRLDSELQLTFEAETEKQRARIDAVARSLLEHWKNQPGILLQPIEPERLATRFRLTHPLLWRLPWRVIVDPRRPWLEGLVRGIARLPGIGRLLVRILRGASSPSESPLSPCLRAPGRTKFRRHAPAPLVQHPQGIHRGKPTLRAARNEAGHRGSRS